MTVFSQFASKALAVAGAFAITGMLLVSSFSTTPVHTVASVLA